MTEIGISYQSSPGREITMIGGLANVQMAIDEAQRGLTLFGAARAVVYSGRILSEGKVLAIVERDKIERMG